MRTTKRRPARPAGPAPDSKVATSFRATCTGSSALGNAIANARSTAVAHAASSCAKKLTLRRSAAPQKRDEEPVAAGDARGNDDVTGPHEGRVPFRYR